MRTVDVLQFLTFLAVLAALLLSFLQMRHAGRQARAATAALERSMHIALVSRQGEFAGVLLKDDPAMMRWHVESRGFTVRDDEEAKRYLYVLIRLNGHQRKFSAHRDGVLSDEYWAAWVNVIALDLAMPEFQVGWAVARPMYPASFVAFVDAMLADLAVPAPAEVLT
ncbi:hypothetical protein [Actinoplanes sp. GCM10030250]|uniref:hypothetical protein n=1 Tax=Actinoplanes sp. GCM10030250 TaxID=3273376 RepID=UPI00361B7557